MQGTRFQHKHRNAQAQAVDDVGDDHIFRPQAAGLGDGELAVGLELHGSLRQQSLGFSQFGGVG